MFDPKAAKFGPKYAFLVIFGQVLAFLIQLVPYSTNNANEAILPQNMLSWEHIGLAGLFGALLVGWLVVGMRVLYLARHLFIL